MLMKILQNSIVTDEGLLAPEWLVHFDRLNCFPTTEMTRLQTDYSSSFLKDLFEKAG